MDLVLPVSVVIPTRNRHDLVGDTVRSILAGNQLPTDIVIVDQSDNPRLPDLSGTPAGPCKIRHVPSSTIGVSRARNEGARLASSSILVFSDDDVLAQPDWLGAMARALQNAGENDAITGRVVAGAPETPGAFAACQTHRSTPHTFEGRLRIDPLFGCNMAIRRAAYEAIGGYDERIGPGTRFPGAEDNDFGFRVLEAGGRIMFEPEAVVYHRAWRSAGGLVPLRYRYGRGKGAFYAKHLRLDDLHMWRRLTRDLVDRSIRTVKQARYPELAMPDVAFSAGIIRGVAEWFLRRN